MLARTALGAGVTPGVVVGRRVAAGVEPTVGAEREILVERLVAVRGGASLGGHPATDAGRSSRSACTGHAARPAP